MLQWQKFQHQVEELAKPPVSPFRFMVTSYWLSEQPVFQQEVSLITNNRHLITAAQNQEVLQAALKLIVLNHKKRSFQ